MNSTATSNRARVFKSIADLSGGDRVWVYRGAIIQEVQLGYYTVIGHLAKLADTGLIEPSPPNDLHDDLEWWRLTEVGVKVIGSQEA